MTLPPLDARAPATAPQAQRTDSETREALSRIRLPPPPVVAELERATADRTGEAVPPRAMPLPRRPRSLPLSALDQARPPQTLRERIERGAHPLDRWFLLGDDAALDPIRPQLEHVESVLDEHILPGEIAGIGLGLLLSLREMISGLASMAIAVADMPWNTTHLMTRADLVELRQMLMNLLTSEIEDQAVTRALAELAFASVGQIIEHLDRAAALGGDGHFTRSSAEIIQATVVVIGMIEGLHGIVQSLGRFPSTVRNLARMRRQWMARLERGRRAVSPPRASLPDSPRTAPDAPHVVPPADAPATGTVHAPRPDAPDGPPPPAASPAASPVVAPPRALPTALADGTALVPGLRRSLARLARRGVDVHDPYTLRYLNDMYARFRGDDIRLLSMRADAGELRALIRYADQPGVSRVRFLDPAGTRTPDIEVLRDGVPEYVEVRTLTQARQRSRVRTHQVDPDSEAPATRRTSPRDRAPLLLLLEDGIAISIRDKIFRGQISAGRPGTLVIHAPFARELPQSPSGWRQIFQDIFAREAPPPGLRRIEVTTGHGTRVMQFDPPHWAGPEPAD